MRWGQANAINKRQIPVCSAVIRSEDGRRRSAIAKQEANAQFRQGWKLERAQAAGRRNQDPIQLQPNDRAAPGAESAVPQSQTRLRETQSLVLSRWALQTIRKNASWGGTNPHRQRQPAALSHT